MTSLSYRPIHMAPEALSCRVSRRATSLLSITVYPPDTVALPRPTQLTHGRALRTTNVPCSGEFGKSIDHFILDIYCGQIDTANHTVRKFYISSADKRDCVNLLRGRVQ
ncbi:hypothetical protein J6590_085707 [Homalodisca vitripennis]|nr:hypothetical protein J6590_085707 [Homalodisca vitripennis]